MSELPEHRLMFPSSRTIKAARILLGWTQADLAQRARVGINTVTRAESDATDARLRTVEAIVEALKAGGIRFLEATDLEGEGIRLRKDAFASLTPPTTETAQQQKDK